MQLLQRTDVARVAGGDCESQPAPAFDPASDPFFLKLVELFEDAANLRWTQNMLENLKNDPEMQALLIRAEHLANNGTANGFITEYGDYVMTEAENFAHNVDGFLSAQFFGIVESSFSSEFGGGYEMGGEYGGFEGCSIGAECIGAMGGEGGC